MLTAFGFVAVTAMFASYWLESRTKWFVLTFAAGSAATALYSGLAQVYPIMIVEALWAVVAMRRFVQRHRREATSA